MGKQKIKAIGVLLCAFALIACMGLAGCSSGGSSSSSAASTASSTSAANIKVTVKVVANDSAKVSAANETVTVPEGASALDALKATSFKPVIENGSYGLYVKGINGVEGTNNSGWMYAVNGKQPSVGAADYKLAADDTVEWSFTTY